MPATESLIKLRGQSSETRGRTTHKVMPFAVSRSSDSGVYAFRTNEILAKTDISKNGEIIRIAVPAFQNVVGEIFFTIDLPALDTGSYDASCVLKMIETVRVRHSDVVIEYSPELVPIFFSHATGTLRVRLPSVQFLVTKRRAVSPKRYYCPSTIRFHTHVVFQGIL